MDFIICFIDDSEFEHDLVRNQIAPCAQGLTFIQAYTFEEARKKLDSRTPVLFLLDLWGQDPDVIEPHIRSKNELEDEISRFKSLDDVYEGLDDFSGDRNNEFLKRLFSIVDSWRTLFEGTCDQIGQNRKYGLANLDDARKLYPGIPSVFYTRKSLINDAVAIFLAKADGLFIKPTGRDDDETRLMTKEFAPELIEKITSLIDAHFMNFPENPPFLTYNKPDPLNNLTGLVKSWKHFRNY